MTKISKFLYKVLRGTSDTDISFDELCGLLTALGFSERTRGSHHIFSHTGIEEIINLQAKGSKAKPYQVKQVRQLIVKYRLVDGYDDSL